ncbi:MAG TPA: c-type cytochrome domain-containing protein, partial [Longimicrobium sp.]|nr:c-type cytochrome domain-containing protein [Longimicrobium sp.]
QKGDLRLDSPEAIEAGGTSGPVVIPGRAAESRMIQRIWLPPGHEDIMPPRGRQPLSVVEAELLRWWIDQGASFEQTMARAVPPPGVRAILEEVAGPAEERVAPVLRMEVAAADSGAVAAARAAGVSLRPLSRGSRFLRASCMSAAEGCGAEQLRALLPLAEQIATLDLSGSPVTDADLATVARLGHLTRLSLDGTEVGDAGLVHLASLRHLEYLNLYGTAVTDAGLEALETLTGLRSLYLWQTAATPPAAARLAERLPRLKVSLGMSASEADSLAVLLRTQRAEGR